MGGENSGCEICSSCGLQSAPKERRRHHAEKRLSKRECYLLLLAFGPLFRHTIRHFAHMLGCVKATLSQSEVGMINLFSSSEILQSAPKERRRRCAEKRTLQKPFCTTVSPHDAFSAPLAHPHVGEFPALF